jgi:dTDP-4-dehydrorhamnose reductase
MGFPVREAGNSFLWRMVNTLGRGEAVAFPRSEVRSPIDVITLSQAILELANHSYCGILHLSGNNALSRFDMAKRIADKLGYPTNLVVDKKPSIETGRAPRPRDVSLCNNRAKMILKTPMLDLNEGIDLIFKNMRDTTL